jgi:ketosteroid isomerase-like protein
MANSILDEPTLRPSPKLVFAIWRYKTSRTTGSVRRELGVMDPVASESDLVILTELNRDYINSVQTSDVRRFDEILAEDFLCSTPDGLLLNKAQFLKHTAAPVHISNLEACDVQVRIMGDFAIIHARTAFTRQNGQSGSGRYTDTWARRNGRWLATSAHITRLLPAAFRQIGPGRLTRRSGRSA